MNIFRPSTCKWNKGFALFLLVLPWADHAPAQKPNSPRPLRPFLEEFKAPETKILTKTVSITSAIGKIEGFMTRPDVTENLPGLLLIPDETGLSPWMKQNVQEIAGLGFVALAVQVRPQPRTFDADQARERTLAELSAAVRWLRRCPGVQGDRLGVVGWSWGAEQALVLAANMRLQGCVICDGAVSPDAAAIAALRSTPILGIFGSPGPERARAVGLFQKALADAKIPHQIHVTRNGGPGFMDPANKDAYHHQEAEQAWVEIYEFLGKYVEDEPPVTPIPIRPLPAIATIADIMRTVNDARGIRGQMMQELEEKPAKDSEWARIRSQAALMVEAGHLLQRLSPKKGKQQDWLDRTKLYVEQTLGLVQAAERHDYAATRLRLNQLKQSCTACHDQHR
jgi:dienelactone hydrolase